MPDPKCGRLPRAVVVAAVAAALASCASEPASKTSAGIGKTKEYFAESEYGVKASPRVSGKSANLPRGGGREQVGRPYKVKGKWYYPKEDPDYQKVGLASWYGEAFHGRLTANGEIYDMTHLTAAHPTMPLPSYARVTNVANGSSVVVRVNDRGPFAHGRVIDLSKRAAELLDYKSSGVAKVKVEYVGRAPLHGRDDAYLMASYRPAGNSAPADGIAPGVMIAMNGPTPSAPAGAAAFPGALRDVATPAQAVPAAVADGSDPALPAVGPRIPERPADGFAPPLMVAALSYADSRVSAAAKPFESFGDGMNPAAIIASWEQAQLPADGRRGYVAVGAFDDAAQAAEIASRLDGLGRVETQTERTERGAVHLVNLYPDGRASLDDMLANAWQAGAADALAVRE